jgi:hydroxymethylbilane synthase
MAKRIIRVGSRESKLAVVQAQIVMDQIKSNFPEYEIKLITMKTTGDIILDKTLDVIGGKGLFVKELDRALLDGKIDISVHSLKDMPTEIDESLPIVAYSKREDPRDVLVLPQNEDEINYIKPVGCSSARRKIQLLDLYENVKIEPVRGNVLTRLNKLDSGYYSALVLASAGLNRLGLANRTNRIFSTQEMIPSAGQGILAIQGRKEDDLSFLSCVNDKNSQDAAIAEREFIKTLDGGCSSPVAAYAEIAGNEIKLTGFYVDVQTGRKIKGEMIAVRSQAKRIGYNLANKLLSEVNERG